MNFKKILNSADVIPDKRTTGVMILRKVVIGWVEKSANTITPVFRRQQILNLFLLF